MPPTDPVDDARRDQRHDVTRPVMAIPVFSNSRPDEKNCFEGVTANLSDGGMAFRTDRPDPPASNRLVVGVEMEEGRWVFCTLEVRRTDRSGDGLKIAGRFAPKSRDVLHPSNLMPTLNSDTHRLTTGPPEETLLHWARLGILRRQVADHVLVCPECRAIPTFRHGCAECGSMRVVRATMIHHYACAHVGDVSDFELDGEIICPKCRARSLVVGSDYEYIYGPHNCWDCGWSGSQLELVGRCRMCDLQFPFGQCPENPLIGYHVERLDPMAIVDAV